MGVVKIGGFAVEAVAALHVFTGSVATGSEATGSRGFETCCIQQSQNTSSSPHSNKGPL